MLHFFKLFHFGRNFWGYFLLRIIYRMMRALSESQISQVEAVYLCLFGATLPDEIKIALIQRLAMVDYNVPSYLHWLVFRWRPLFATHLTHLPSRSR